MEACIKNFEEIFILSEKRFEVPFFQRKYVWGEDNWKRCLEDIRIIAAEGTPHFMGSLIFKTESDVDRIIDGQQRLTTLCILYYALCKKRNQPERLAKCFELPFGEYKITHNYIDSRIFNWIIYTDCEPGKEPPSLSLENNLIYQCLDYFMAELENDPQLQPEILEQKLYFVSINLASQDDEQAIFETLNSLGVALTVAELLKNDLFRKESPEFFQKTWGHTFESRYIEGFWGEEISIGKREKVTKIDMFLRAYYDIVTVNATSEYKKFQSLFKNYQQHIDQYVNDKHEFIRDLTETAELYRKLFNPELVVNGIRNLTPLQRLCFLSLAFQRTQLVPYILYVRKNADPVEADKISKLLETYIMRRLICDLTPIRYNLQFKSLISQKILTYDALLANLSENKEDTSRMPTRKEVWNSLVSGTRKMTMNKLGKVMLFLIERHLRQNSKSDRTMPAYNDCELEYLMPKNITQWVDQQDLQNAAPEYLKKVHLKLGNISLTTRKLTKNLSESIWHEKVEDGLLDHCAQFETTADYIKLPAWGIDAINARTCDLANIALEIWDYELDTQEENISINRTNMNAAMELVNRLAQDKQPYKIMLLLKHADKDLTEFHDATQKTLLKTIAEMDQQMSQNSTIDLQEAEQFKFYNIMEMNFQGTKPVSLKFFDQYYECTTWKDVLFQILRCFIQHDPHKMRRLCQNEEISSLKASAPRQAGKTLQWEIINEFCAVQHNLGSERLMEIARSIAGYFDFPYDAIAVSLKQQERQTRQRRKNR